MNIWTKPIYIKIRIRFLLVLLIILAIVVAGVVLYKNYVFHNLFFKTLSSDNIESVSVYGYYGKGPTALSRQETEDVVLLLRKIRVKEEPYTNYGLIGNKGDGYHIRLKNGITFDLDFSGGDPGVYIINNKAYSIGYREDLSTYPDFENIWRLEELYDTYVEKYYPDDK